MKSKRKRLVQGRDYHAWAWKSEENDDMRGLYWYAKPERPTAPKPSGKGKWVRVRFVEVKSV